MKAVQFHHFGAPSVLSIDRIKRPEPKADEVLVKVHAAALNPKDCMVRKGKFRLFTGAKFPQQVGYDFAGEVAEQDKKVEGLTKGQAVYGMLNRWSGGACAEYVTAPADELAPMPDSLDFEQVAAVPLAAQTALQALRDLGRIREDAKVLINGASGGVGTFAVQIAKVYGAEVTAVCSHRNARLVERLGADRIIDYSKQDIRKLRERFEIFFDVFGNQNFFRALPLLKPRGVYISTVPRLDTIAAHLLTQPFLLRKSRLVLVKSKRDDLDVLARMIDDGRIEPVVDRIYPLEEAATAQAYIETKRASGKVVLKIGNV